MKLSSGEETFMLHCQCYGLLPEREFKFALPRKWRLDFAWPAQKIGVEIEGGTWVQGRHNRGSSIAADFAKYNAAAAMGWRLFRYTTEQAVSGEAIDQVLEALR